MNFLDGLVTGLVVGGVITYYFWRTCLEKSLGEVLAGKRDWRIGNRVFMIVEKRQ